MTVVQTTQPCVCAFAVRGCSRGRTMPAKTRLFSVAFALLIAAAVPAVPASAAPATFTHPGVLVSRAQLDFVRDRVNANAQPWRDAYNQMIASQYASLSRTPTPRAVVECGPFSNPNLDVPTNGKTRSPRTPTPWRGT